jgi:LysR family hydrogen peroxide-inducible transcriptional activator
MEPTLRQLEYLVALADTLSFREAAERCLVTQPGLSMQIRELEEKLGVQLFERSRRRVVATAAGTSLALRARRILHEVDELTDTARALRAPLTGDLRLGVIPTVAPFVLPRVLLEVRACYPELRLHVHEDRTAALVELLHEGKLDLLLLAEESDIGGCTVLPLYRDPFQLAVPRDHPLAKRKRVSERNLAELPLLLLDDGH